MSYFDDASLVMIPSGYKTSKVYSVKPTDGTGDLAFTRSNDTATRVGSDGLIEKVRTNLILQSETFDNASWNKSLDGQVTITANAAVAPNGSTTADKMIPSAIAGFHCVQQQVTLSAGEASVSVYAKAVENSFLQIFDALTTEFVNFNLTTGVVGSSSAYVGSIEDAGNGWYRCKATKVVPSGTFSARIAVVTTATAARGESFTGNGTNGLLIWGAQLETGVMTDYIATTSAAVSVGMLANVPRLDYLNSSCPRLLLEPQRTNLLLNSENYSGSNWSLGNATVTNNQAVSPDGYTNADLLKEDSTNNFHRLFDVGKTISTTTAYTSSVFVKNASGTRNFRISFGGGFGEQYVTFNVINGTIVASDNATGTIVSYGNGWYRCTATATSGAVANVNAIYWLTSGNTETYQGNGTSGVYLYGSQLEAGAYATSYIPTLGAAVTRGADAASKTGISSLIGQTEGTLFFEYPNFQTDGNEGLVGIDDGTGVNRVLIFSDSNSRITGQVRANSVTQNITPFIVSGNVKVAVAYNASGFVFFVNGAVRFTGTGVVFSSAMSVFTFNHLTVGASITNQALLFKTRLTNADLAALTA